MYCRRQWRVHVCVVDKKNVASVCLKVKVKVKLKVRVRVRVVCEFNVSNVLSQADDCPSAAMCIESAVET